MNAAAKFLPIALRPEVPSTPAEAEWIADAAEHLMNLRDVQFKRRLHSPQGVTFERFALAVDEYVMDQLSGSGVSNSALGRLVLHARCKGPEAATTADELLNCANPDEELLQIAKKLLKPLAADALIALAEDDEL
jgi:hypothetical protein